MNLGLSRSTASRFSPPPSHQLTPPGHHLTTSLHHSHHPHQSTDGAETAKSGVPTLQSNLLPPSSSISGGAISHIRPLGFPMGDGRSSSPLPNEMSSKHFLERSLKHMAAAAAAQAAATTKGETKCKYMNNIQGQIILHLDYYWKTCQCSFYETEMCVQSFNAQCQTKIIVLLQILH